MTLRNPNVLGIPEAVASLFPRFIPRDHAMACGANGTGAARQLATRTRIGMLLAASENESGLRLLQTTDTLVALVREYSFRIAPATSPKEQVAKKCVFRWARNNRDVLETFSSDAERTAVTFAVLLVIHRFVASCFDDRHVSYAMRLCTLLPLATPRGHVATGPCAGPWQLTANIMPFAPQCHAAALCIIEAAGLMSTMPANDKPEWGMSARTGLTLYARAHRALVSMEETPAAEIVFGAAWWLCTAYACLVPFALAEIDAHSTGINIMKRAIADISEHAPAGGGAGGAKGGGGGRGARGGGRGGGGGGLLGNQAIGSGTDLRGWADTLVDRVEIFQSAVAHGAGHSAAGEVVSASDKAPATRAAAALVGFM